VQIVWTFSDGNTSAQSSGGVTVAGTATARTFSGAVSDLNTYFTTAGSITYTSALNSTAARTLTTSVSDGSLSNSATSTIDVTAVNDAPVLITPISALSALEDVAFSHVLPADTFADADAGDSLTWSVTRTDGAALPAWLAFDPATRVLAGTPDNADVGTLELRISVTDMAGATVSDTFTLTVANVNDMPTGRPLITGAAGVGRTLGVDLASIADDDGPGTLATSAEYQWLRGGVAVPGATGASYVVALEDVGQTLTVNVSWVDGRGTRETLASSAVGPVPQLAFPLFQLDVIPSVPNPSTGNPVATVAPTIPTTPLPSASGSTPNDTRESSSASPTPDLSSPTASEDAVPESGPAGGSGRASAQTEGRSFGQMFAGFGVHLNTGAATNFIASGASPLDLPVAAMLSATDGVRIAPIGSIALPASPLTAVESQSARAEVANLMRRVRERVPEAAPTASSSRPVSSLVLEAVQRPRVEQIEDLPGLMVGATDMTQITGLVATTGVVLWAARSGGLSLALLASVPIWRNLDPLYVLSGKHDAAAAAAAAEGESEDDTDLPAVLPAGLQLNGRLVITSDAEA
jgi:hypothetical protein